MKNLAAIIITIIVTSTTLFIYNDYKNTYSSWEDVGYITDSLASDLTAYLSEEGIFYPVDDLNDLLLKKRKIVINNSLNEQTTKEVVRKLLYLNSIDENNGIDLYISTQGGWYDSAFTIIDTFNDIKAPVNTICIGGCYSAGAVLLAAGTGERISHPNALFSIHISYDQYDDNRPYAKYPDRVNNFLRKHANLPNDWFPLENDRYFYLDSEQALKFSLIDKISKQHKR